MLEKPVITIAEVRDFCLQHQGQDLTLAFIRTELGVRSDTESFDRTRVHVSRLIDQKILRPVGRKGGNYKVVTQVEPVIVFNDRERRPLYKLNFPKSSEIDVDGKDINIEMDFAQYIILREGDLITVGGVKSSGKTTFMLNICGENVDQRPILMGNEYTVLAEDKFEPAPRFLSRLDSMGWVDWIDVDGKDKFILLPVSDDYAEHIVKNKLNIIDWIDIDGERLYGIGKVLKGIKNQLGRGIAVVALQKGETAGDPRGGQFVRDYSDLEILLDSFGDDPNDVLLTIRGCKEKTASIVGKTYAYSISKGVAIHHFREVKKCPQCHAQGYIKGEKCKECYGAKYVNA